MHRSLGAVLFGRGDGGKDRLGLRGAGAVADGHESVAGGRSLIATGFFGPVTAPGELEHQRGPLLISCRPEFECLPERPRRCAKGAERVATHPCITEGDTSALPDHRVVGTRRPRKLERPAVMVREHLDVVVSIRDKRVDPFRSEPVLLGAHSARNLSVRNVADKHVSERVLRFACNG